MVSSSKICLEGFRAGVNYSIGSHNHRKTQKYKHPRSVPLPHFPPYSKPCSSFCCWTKSLDTDTHIFLRRKMYCWALSVCPLRMRIVPVAAEWSKCCCSAAAEVAWAVAAAVVWAVAAAVVEDFCRTRTACTYCRLFHLGCCRSSTKYTDSIHQGRCPGLCLDTGLFSCMDLLPAGVEQVVASVVEAHPAEGEAEGRDSLGALLRP